MSFLAACVLTSVKILVAAQTASLGLLSEALHSGLDLLASGITLVAVGIAEKPADAEHAFGHGKAENLAALAQTLLLFATCFWIIWEALARLITQESHTEPSVLALGVMLLSIAIDVNRVRVLKRVAKEHQSQALEADALHFSSDIWSSAVVLAGIFLVFMGHVLGLPPKVQALLALADPLAALVVAILILATSLRMGRSSIQILMDTSPPKLKEAAIAAMQKVPGIREISKVRIRQSGAQYFATATIHVDAENSTERSHALAHAAEDALLTVLPEADVTIHVEPMSAQTPLDHVQATAAKEGLRLHHVQIFGEKSPWHILFHLEVPGTLDYTLAHARVSRFEEQLTKLFPNTSITSHLEPEHSSERAQAIDLVTKEECIAQAKCAAAADPLLGEPTNFLLSQTQEGLIFSFHCPLLRALSVAQAHDHTSSLEQAIAHTLKTPARVTIHLEPAFEPKDRAKA